MTFTAPQGAFVLPRCSEPEGYDLYANSSTSEVENQHLSNSPYQRKQREILEDAALPVLQSVLLVAVLYATFLVFGRAVMTL